MVHKVRQPCPRSCVEEMDAMSNDKIVHLAREQVESNLRFAGFLVFHCPLKEDAVETLKALADSSHRVRELHHKITLNPFLPSPFSVS